MLRIARGAPRAGAFPVHPRGRAPARIAADQLFGAGDFHRYLIALQGGEIVSV